MLGLVMYSMFSRQPPFHDLSTEQIGELIPAGLLSLATGGYLSVMKDAAGALKGEWLQLSELMEWCTAHDKNSRPSLQQVCGFVHSSCRAFRHFSFFFFL